MKGICGLCGRDGQAMRSCPTYGLMSECPGHFECAKCHRTFTKTRSEEEVLAEARSMFGAEAVADPADRVSLCDDCHHEVLAWARVHYPDVLR